MRGEVCDICSGVGTTDWPGCKRQRLVRIIILYTNRPVDSYLPGYQSRCPLCTLVMHLLWEDFQRVANGDECTAKVPSCSLTCQVQSCFLGSRRISVWIKGLVNGEVRDSFLRLRALPPEGLSSLYDNITLSLRTDSDEAITTVSNWLDQCRSNHATCRRHIQQGTFMPTRLIDVGAGAEGDSFVRLVHTNQIPTAPYIALSHRWGNSATLDAEKLTQARVSHYKDSIHLHLMSAYIQDAVWLTRKLKFRYLWVDFLCIIQDSEEDWAAEAAIMGNVYEYCALTIAASLPAESLSQNKGLFTGGKFRMISGPFKARLPAFESFTEDLAEASESFTVLHTSVYYCTNPSIWEREVTAASLNTRGWVLQERWLSPCTVYTGQWLLWECGELNASEAYPRGEQVNAGWVDVPKKWRDTLTKEVKKLNHLVIRARVWQKLVEQYTRCNLTRCEDRLIAIKGIAQRFGAEIKDTYIAGLWHSHIFWDLGWYVTDLTISQETCDNRLVPSWSWVSPGRPVIFSRDLGDRNLYSDLKILEIRAGQQTPKARIESPIWVMVLQAPLIPVPSSVLGPITFSVATYTAYEYQFEHLSGPHLLKTPLYFPDQVQPLKDGCDKYLLPLQTVKKLCTATPIRVDVDELCMLVLERSEVSKELSKATHPFDYGQWVVYKRIGYLRLFFTLSPSSISLENPLEMEFSEGSKKVIGRETWVIEPECGITAQKFVLI